MSQWTPPTHNVQWKGLQITLQLKEPEKEDKLTPKSAEWRN
jgi:hypothetical protein